MLCLVFGIPVRLHRRHPHLPAVRSQPCNALPGTRSQPGRSWRRRQNGTRARHPGINPRLDHLAADPPRGKELAPAGQSAGHLPRRIRLRRRRPARRRNTPPVPAPLRRFRPLLRLRDLLRRPGTLRGRRRSAVVVPDLGPLLFEGARSGTLQTKRSRPTAPGHVRFPTNSRAHSARMPGRCLVRLVFGRCAGIKPRASLR